jgi:hypothetical protein
MPEQKLRIKPAISPVGPEGGRVHSEVEFEIQRIRGGGQPLEPGLQKQMSASMEYDFSKVRIHTSPEADELSRQLSAKAFTIGSDVFFAQKAYNPDTRTGRELIAHELVHVAQQNYERIGGQEQGITIRPAGDVFEREADKLSRVVGGGGKVKTSDILQCRHPEGAVVQRALAARAALAIAGAGGGAWNGIATSCHFATIYWIIRDELGRVPTPADFATIGNLTGAIRSMVQTGGVRINQPGRGGQVNLTAGSVIVFERNNQPAHSCVATHANQVGGYNQLGWFTAGGLNHGYSSHNTNQFKAWGGIFNRNKIRGNPNNTYCRLYSVSEDWAKATIWQHNL